MWIKQSQSTAALRRVVIGPLANTSDDSAHTGTLSGSDFQVSKAGGSFATGSGTVTNLGNGYYAYTFATGEIDTLGHLILKVNVSGVYPDAFQHEVVAVDPMVASSMGMSNLDVAVSSRLATESYQDVDDWLDVANTIESGVTLRKALRAIAAYAAGNVTGGGSGTETFSAIGNSGTPRFVSTPTSAGSRTVTLSLG